jgi:hypothetical protein
MTPEQRARQVIDRLSQAKGWYTFGLADAGIYAALGVAACGLPLSTAGRAVADSLPVGKAGDHLEPLA